MQIKVRLLTKSFEYSVPHFIYIELKRIVARKKSFLKRCGIPCVDVTHSVSAAAVEP